ncbi:hypothetical protein RJ45_03585 [Photobacterium gaetbulicola]|uniref:DUF7661 domain-containing protein n=2 Tax=Photobacterium gaetbulicola TaxID=1295392 RepID=A0A0B9H1Z3_9GAMM|nr:hypothetical protein [Photobacterium gaetbulicola]KHT64966.1 hypothetical protein RJ45_03585 [Photobacterium gaetbulicola]
MFLLFDVFSTKMSVQQKDGFWLLYKESDTAMRARIYDVVIPPELEEGDLATYLADIYHENATANYPDVRRC